MAQQQSASCKRKSSDPMRLPCPEGHLAQISKSISDWRAVSPFLRLTEAEESEILESTHSVPARKMAMLRKWKQKHGTKATYENLCRAFDYCDRADLVDKVKQLLAESNSSSDEEGTSQCLGIHFSKHVVIFTLHD